jgi:hypothetical protein
MGGTVTIFDPNGNKGEVPYGNLAAAVKAGGKLAVTVKAPDGTMGEIPADRVPDAAKAGGTVVPFQDQENQHPGFWAKAADLMGGLLHPSGFSPYPGMDQDAKSAAAGQSYDLSQSEKAAGYSPLYRAAVPIARSAGTDVAGMEQSAKEGDTGGVLAAAAVPIATLGAGELIHQTGAVGKAVDASKSVIPAVRSGIAATADVGSAALDNPIAGAISPRLPHVGKMLGSVADIVRPTPEAPLTYPGAPLPENPGTFPGAPLPETPPQELLQAGPLATGGAAPPAEPAAALGRIPAPESPPTQLPAAFQPLPPKPPAVPGTVDLPFKSLHELPVPAVQQALTELGPKAPIEDLTQRANQLANQWPPEAAQVKAQKVSPSAEDVLDDKAVEEQIRNATSAEDQTRLREIYGANRLGSDVSTPKGRLTGTMGEGSDVYIRDRSGDRIPDITAMTKDIATPAQAMRQVDLLTKAGASKAAIESFKRAAKVKFGENWQSGTDDLTPILQKSLDQVRQSRPSS